MNTLNNTKQKFTRLLKQNRVKRVFYKNGIYEVIKYFHGLISLQKINLTDDGIIIYEDTNFKVNNIIIDNSFSYTYVTKCK